MIIHSILQELLPISPLSIQQFISQQTPNRLIHSTSNNFFKPIPTTGGSTKIRINDDEEGGGCWNTLPLEWREYFNTFSQRTFKDREELLKDLANANHRDDYPSTLSHFLSTCSSLSLNRTQSSLPLLRYPPSPSSPKPPTSYPAPSSATKKGPKVKQLTNSERAGLNDKKAHEVLMFTELTERILKETMGTLRRPTHAIDIGSGRAHLSRRLTLPPLNLHILALDHSSSQTSGAEKLDKIHSRPPKASFDVPSSPSSCSPSSSGTLEHRTCSLDEESIGEMMRVWPEGKEKGKAMLVALHACGDLTPDTLKAFVNEERENEGRERCMIAVGCCYNLMDPDRFPLSDYVTLTSNSVPSFHLSRESLLISPQSPSLWHLTPSSISSLNLSISKLLLRARFEIELNSSGYGLSDGQTRKGLDKSKGGNGVPRVGRVSGSKVEGGWGEYRKAAIGRMGYLGGEEDGGSDGDGGIKELEFEGGEEKWEEAKFLFQAFWTLRSLLGPVLESLIVLDRWIYLVEKLYERGVWKEGNGGDETVKVDLMNLFDQRTGSSRNLALVVR